jgi:hypothetical protein
VQFGEVASVLRQFNRRWHHGVFHQDRQHHGAVCQAVGDLEANGVVGQSNRRRPS